MDQKTYIANALRTAAPVPATCEHIHPQVVHCALGIAGEWAEVQVAFLQGNEIELEKEIGDIYWYIAVMAHQLGLANQLSMYRRVQLADESVAAGSVGDLVEMVKKQFAYGKKYKPVDYLGALQNICDTLSQLIREMDFNSGNIWAKNIRKLKERYPEKFDADKAINRDVKAENAAVGG